ncbi:MAG: thioredoxin family protein [Burkholderiaceae bacterium]|nr:thioredoxin family protein [Burkholderiaceae bacterium]
MNDDAPDWQRWPAHDVHRRLRVACGRVLLMFARRGCGTCRVAEARLPTLARGRIDTLVYLDADDCGGLLREFEVFHLPAMFLYRDGVFHAPLSTSLQPEAFAAAIDSAYAAAAQDAP